MSKLESGLRLREFLVSQKKKKIESIFCVIIFSPLNNKLIQVFNHFDFSTSSIRAGYFGLAPVVINTMRDRI